MLHIRVEEDSQVIGVQEIDPLTNVVVDLKNEEDYQVEYIDPFDEIERRYEEHLDEFFNGGEE